MQQSIRCAVYRGGTSRGLFFKEEDLPKDRALWNDIFLEGIDAYNVSQINGLGGGTSHTSKVMVIHPSSREDADLDYTFYQIGIGEPIVDSVGTCGNLMAGVGAFAVNEGYVDIEEGAEAVTVRTFNRNIDRYVEMTVPVIRKQARVFGEDEMSGVVQKGAMMDLFIVSPGGGKTGSTFPKGTETDLRVGDRTYRVTFSDIVNPFIYVDARDFGFETFRTNEELAQDEALLETLKQIRIKGSVYFGVTKDETDAKNNPAVPKVALIYPKQRYVTTSGDVVEAEEYDILARMTSMDRIHRTFAGSGLYNIASCAGIDGTIPAKYASASLSNVVRVAHPDGIVNVHVEWNEEKTDVTRVGLPRTAKRIMEGQLFIESK